MTMLATPVQDQYKPRHLHSGHMEPSTFHLYQHGYQQWTEQDESKSKKLDSGTLAVFNGAGDRNLSSRHIDVPSNIPSLLQQHDGDDTTLVEPLVDPSSILPHFAEEGHEVSGVRTNALPDFSIPKPETPNVQVLEKPLSELVQILGKLALSRLETASLRTEIAFIQKTSQHQSAHLLESTQQSLLAIQRSGLLDSTEAERLTQQLADDHAEFERTTVSIRARETDLNHLEFNMKNHEEQLNQIAQDLIKNIKIIGILGPEELDRLESQEPGAQPISPRPATPTYPKVLEDYFDKTGDISVMQERLEQLQSDYRDELVRRQLRTDQELPLEMTSELFEADYRASLESAVIALDNARSAADSAHAACLSAGIEPKDHMQHITPREVPESEVASSVSAYAVGREARSRTLTAQSSASDLRRPNDQAKQDPNQGRGKTKKPRRRKKRNSTRVRRWMDVSGASGMHTAEDLQDQLDALEAALWKPGTTIRRGRSLTGLRDSALQNNSMFGTPIPSLSTARVQVSSRVESGGSEEWLFDGRTRSSSM